MKINIFGPREGSWKIITNASRKSKASKKISESFFYCFKTVAKYSGHDFYPGSKLLNILKMKQVWVDQWSMTMKFSPDFLSSRLTSQIYFIENHVNIFWKLILIKCPEMTIARFQEFGFLFKIWGLDGLFFKNAINQFTANE